MGSISSSSSGPRSWIPYMNSRDCSQGFCSLYCPQWCYTVIPPPPSFEYDSSSSPNFSPLIIAIIGILVSAFLLVSYYILMSKYCGNEDQRSRSREDHIQNEQPEGSYNSSIHGPWYVVTVVGLDEAVIKSLRVCKFKKGDEVVEGTDCAICLSEVEEDESLRLLPKCNHAFHLPCIDTWLKSHSNCPLCRATIVSINPPQLSPHVVNETTPPPPSSSSEDANVVMEAERSEYPEHEEIVHGDVIPKTPLRGFRASEERDTVIEIRGDEAFQQSVRRSVSMDYSHQNNRVIVRMNDEEHVEGSSESESESDEIADSSKSSAAAGRVGISI